MDEISGENNAGDLNCYHKDNGRKIWSHSKSFRFRPSSSDIEMEDMRGSNLEEIIRVTNGNKSFSHNPHYEESKSYPLWKCKALVQMEEIKTMIREKFDKSKEEVNAEIVRFTNDLINELNNSSKFTPEWKNDLENLLLVAQQCAKMSSKEFWFKCEGIVRDLDYRRQKLPSGSVKQAHTRLLFILTRCTRLVQVHKDS